MYCNKCGFEKNNGDCVKCKESEKKNKSKGLIKTILKFVVGTVVIVLVLISLGARLVGYGLNNMTYLERFQMEIDGSVFPEDMGDGVIIEYMTVNKIESI